MVQTQQPAAQHPTTKTDDDEAAAGILGVSFLSDAILNELLVFWGFTWRDFSMSVIPGSMYTLAALRSLSPTPPAAVFLTTLTRSILYFLIFIYAFDLANQINGVAEDRINKPDRPLSSGLVTLKGAYVRWYLTTGLLLGMAYAWGIPQWAAMWVVLTVYTSWCGGDKHWTTKNLLFMSVGSLSILTAAWGLAAPITPRVWRSMLQLSAMFGVVASVQDMRDAAGDKVAGRRTLPILLGSSFRWVMASVIALAPVAGWKLGFIYSTSELVGVCGAALTMAMFYLAYRVVVGNDKKYHHGTYMVLTYIYCGCVAVPMLFP
ncbi:hypothetical protein HMN09_00386300 [Mycena chlorophos]|uniref:UbiA prenyltransferase n=1 Tax=Mycena chlorophos TaxID=658473 RepID=A0A8H6TH19_MYCCL|nr:hypothetical protein HMN09_00386300 [Mycena chlorophos]